MSLTQFFIRLALAWILLVSPFLFVAWAFKPNGWGKYFDLIFSIGVAGWAAIIFAIGVVQFKLLMGF